MEPSPQRMSAMFTRNIVWMLLVVLPLTGVTTARGEGDTAADSTEAQGVIQKLTPTYTGGISGDVSSVSMTNQFSNSLEFSNGLKMRTSLKIKELNYRLQDRSENTKALSHMITNAFKSGIIVTGVFSDNRVNNRIISVGGAVQDFIVNTKQATVNSSYSTKIAGGISLGAHSNVRFSASEKNFKVDHITEGALGGGFGYRFGDRVSVSGGAFIKQSGGQSEAGGLRFRGLGVSQDSLRSRISVQVTDSANVNVQYTRFNSTRETIDLASGTFLERDLEETDLIREEQIQNVRTFSIDANVKPMRGVELRMSARHIDNSTDFAVEKRRSSRTVSDNLKGDLTYNLAEKTAMTLSLERNDILNDFGPQSVSSYDSKQQNVTASLRHAFTQTLSMNIQASTSLHQNYYIDFDINPRDRDQLREHLSLRLSSKPFAKIEAGIVLSVSSMEVVNIDRSYSVDNRRETTYDLKPRIVYRMNDRIQVTQNYGLNIGFTEFVFKEDENFLDRNITFSNLISTQLSKSIHVDFNYELRLHDRGSYLRESPGAERLLDIESEDRTDATRIRFQYQINSHLNVVGEQDYNRRVDRVGSGGRETEFIDGGITCGLQGKYKWGSSGELSFTLAKVNRFGGFGSEEQNDYWRMDSRVRYIF